ncbi:MAG TPA: amidohydrolase family protein, partial [Polyangiales bacterium]
GMPGGGMPGGSFDGGSGLDAGMGRDPDTGMIGQGDGGLKPGDGGYFDVPTDPTDPEKVCQKMLDPSKEFIFDIQTHHVNRANQLYTNFLRGQSQFSSYCGPMGMSEVRCFDRNEYARLMFLESDTTIAVLSGLPAVDDANNPLTNAEIAMTRDILNGFAEGTQRLVNHHMVLPNQMGVTPDAVQRQLDAMVRTKDTFKTIGAWKCYPAWSPQNTETNALDGWFLDDPATGRKFIEKGLELGTPVFCIHKGLPIPAFSTRYNDPRDIGVVSKAYPDARFVVYHSAYGHQNALYIEGAYQMGSRVGVNALITSLIENGIGPGSNVYAELGTTWQLVTTSLSFGGLDMAAHVVGKLLKYVGPDNVVWGTDSIWYGSPQQQIEMFLQFQISKAFQQQYGYPELTMEIKRKILGLNSARIYDLDTKAVRCAVDRTKLALQKRELDAEVGSRRWAFLQPPLRTRRDFLAFHHRNGFRPG